MLLSSVGRVSVPCAEALSSLQQPRIGVPCWGPLLHVTPPLSHLLTVNKGQKKKKKKYGNILSPSQTFEFDISELGPHDLCVSIFLAAALLICCS